MSVDELVSFAVILGIPLPDLLDPLGPGETTASGIDVGASSRIERGAASLGSRRGTHTAGLRCRTRSSSPSPLRPGSQGASTGSGTIPEPIPMADLEIELRAPKKGQRK